MIFGAGNGVTTLGLRASSAGFTRRRIKKKITKTVESCQLQQLITTSFVIHIVR